MKIKLCKVQHTSVPSQIADCGPCLASHHPKAIEFLNSAIISLRLATLKSHRDWQAWWRVVSRCHQRLTGRADEDLCFKVVQNRLTKQTNPNGYKNHWACNKYMKASIVGSFCFWLCVFACFVSQSMRLCLNHKLKSLSSIRDLIKNSFPDELLP